MLIKLGKMGLRSSWKLKSKFAGRAFKRSLVRCVIIGLMTVVIRHYVKDSIRIVKKHNGVPEHHKRGGHPHKHSRKLSASEYDDEDELMLEELEHWEPVKH